jgi:hypothetical protein
MTERQTQEPQTHNPPAFDARLVAAVLAPLALVGAAIAALREAH